jgi:hypothetical protein
MTEQQTVTVAGVPVTVQAADGALTVTIGRFDPTAARPLLHLHPRFGTATVGVYIADETGDTTHRPDQRWFSGLYPWHARRDGKHPPVRWLLPCRHRPAPRMRRRLHARSRSRRPVPARQPR